MLKALRDEVIVRLVYQKREGLIAIPQSAIKFKQYDGQVYGQVLSVGPKHKLGVKAGDIINWQRHEGKKIIFGGQTYFAVRERWVMGRVNGS